MARAVEVANEVLPKDSVIHGVSEQPHFRYRAHERWSERYKEINQFASGKAAAGGFSMYLSYGTGEIDKFRERNRLFNDFGLALLSSDQKLRVIAKDVLGTCGKRTGVVSDARFLNFASLQYHEMCCRWKSMNVAWTPASKILSCILYYLKGQKLGSEPITAGLCAFCGCWLYGRLKDPTFGNMVSGPIVSIDGDAVADVHKQPTDYQSPFLLRWAPPFFAQYVPQVFHWDARTRKLSLRKQWQVRPPWCRQAHYRNAQTNEQWLYYPCCKNRLTGHGGATVPFADRSTVDTARHGLNFALAFENTAALATATEREAWAAKLRDFSRRTKGNFCSKKFGPATAGDLLATRATCPFMKSLRIAVWHGCPCVSWSMVCGMRPTTKADTVTKNPMAKKKWRRNPHQIANTLAFMIDSRDDTLHNIPQNDQDAVRECMRWLEFANPFYRRFWALTKDLMRRAQGNASVVPLQVARLRTRICSKRRPPSVHDEESQLLHTVPTETQCLAVIDIAEFPSTWLKVEDYDVIGYTWPRADGSFPGPSGCSYPAQNDSKASYDDTSSLSSFAKGAP